jgi:rhamnose transport system ATP-binding protein
MSSNVKHGSPILSMANVSKSFGAVVALKSGALQVHRGSIHALVGENGAGKSTLVKIVSGLHSRDSGTFDFDGHSVDFQNTAEAKNAGIAIIYQEPTLFPDLSITENIFMGRQLSNGFGRLDRKGMRSKASELIDRLGVSMDPDRLTRGLSIADQQIVEIAKAISQNAKLLVMDEPTAALSGVEVERLTAIARSLRDEGRALIFISHRFDEVFDLCDTITIMRDGEYISRDPVGDISVDDVVRRMVGREITNYFPKTLATIGESRLEVRDLCSSGLFQDISFNVRAGEIVCLAGLVGSGRSEIARAIFGVDDYNSGEVLIDGRVLRQSRPAESISNGMAFVPEDRRQQGLVMDLSLSANIALAVKERLQKFGILTSRMEVSTVREWAGKLQVKALALDVRAGTLSGGNQQKVVLAKWLATLPQILIIDEPTRGIDVGTKSEVHRLLSELAGKGVAILMISSELPEVLGMADRILVLREGRISAEMPRAQATPENVMYAATHWNQVVK